MTSKEPARRPFKPIRITAWKPKKEPAEMKTDARDEVARRVAERLGLIWASERADSPLWDALISSELEREKAEQCAGELEQALREIRDRTKPDGDMADQAVNVLAKAALMISVHDPRRKCDE